MRSPKTIALFLVLAALFSLALAAKAAQWPRPQGPVADYAKMIPEQYLKKITALSTELRQKTGDALVVATVPSIGNESIEEAAVRIFEAWGIGLKGKDNGILLLVAQKERKMRIEVGYGLEGIVTDATAGRVRDQAILPYFKKGDFGAGVWLGVANLAKIIADDKGVKLTGLPESAPGKKGGSAGFAAIFVIIALGIIILRMARRGGRGGRGGGLVTGMVLGSMMGGGRSSGGGFDSFGGGFGGFGGGMSGGGGASGSW